MILRPAFVAPPLGDPIPMPHREPLCRPGSLGQGRLISSQMAATGSTPAQYAVATRAQPVSATCYLSNRCSDKLSEYNQSGSNLRLQRFSTLVVELLQTVVGSPYLLGRTPNELHSAGRSIERNVRGY